MARTWLIALSAAFLVVEGSLDYGETFAHELLETTSVLMETSEAAVKLKWRLFPEPYVIHWAADKAQ
jgi:hypothetical protein